MIYGWNRNRVKNPGEIGLDKGFPHAWREQVSPGPHFPHTDKVNPKALVMLAEVNCDLGYLVQECC